MDGFIILLALAIFGLPIILSIIALSKVSSQARDIAALKRSVELLLRRDTEGPLSRKQKTTVQQKVAKPEQKKTASVEAHSPQVRALRSNEPVTKQAQKPTPPPPSKPTKPKKSLEELIGAQWSVWVGGLALLVGAVFLLRYSIEAGFFTPIMRVTMAGFLGLVLLGAGEWLHRADIKRSAKSRPGALAERIAKQAYIPTLLTAIGIFTLYGSAYAAYALYGFIDPVPAFLILGLISLAAFGFSFRHGPVLAAIGLLGSLVTPLLVQTETPNVYMLYSYLLVISAASFGVAKLRNWDWLNLATLFGWLGWSVLSLEAGQSLETYWVWFVFLGIGFGLNVWIAERTAYPSEKKSSYKTLAYTPHASLIWSFFAAALIFAVNADWDIPSTLYRAGLMSGAVMMGAAWISKRQSFLAIIGAGLGFLLIASWGLSLRSMNQTLLMVGLFSAALLFFSVLKGRFRTMEKLDVSPAIWTGLGTAYPALLFGILFLSKAPQFETTFGLIYLALSLIFAALALYVRSEHSVSAKIFALASGGTYLLSVLIGLSGNAESLALIMGIIFAASAAWQFRAKTPRLLAVGFALFSAGHSLFLRIADGEVATRFILNELWLYFALPALVCAGVAWLLSRKKTDIWSEGLKAISLTFAALFLIFQIRHIMNGGNVLADRLSFDELSLQVLTGLSFSFGATRLAKQDWAKRKNIETRILPILAMGVSAVTLLLFAFGVCLAKSPLFNAAELVNGNLILNSLTLGYLLPAGLLILIGKYLKLSRPELYLRVLGGLALLSAMLFVTTMIRFGFSGRLVSIFTVPVRGFELYAISAAWLIMGIGLLIVGLKLVRLDLRLASAILILMTVLKAFLVDMAGLEGVLRALSFVVLGLILIVIGRSYQKLLFSKSIQNGD